MNVAFADARYADELERCLYNGALSGVSLKGDTYFYMNPLEAGTDRARWVWHDCPCCPPMFLKLMGAMPGYIYSTDADSLYVNLFVSSQASTEVAGTPLSIRQSSRYPWEGNVKIFVDPATPASFGMMVRVPGWCRRASLKINGQSIAHYETVRGYARLSRTWKKGDVIELAMDMPVEAVKAHPLVVADAGKVALIRGPLIYCLESADNNQPIRQVAVPAQAKFSAAYAANLLNGVVAITVPAKLMTAPTWLNNLYASAQDLPEPKAIEVRAVPYYANANRGPVEMTVWLPET
jgi:uncharacterized protein